MDNESPKYLLVKREEAIALAEAVDLEAHPHLKQTVERLRDDTGGDVIYIANRLKKMDYCSACIIESQETYCHVNATRKLGRRLLRLIERAEHIRSPGNKND